MACIRYPIPHRSKMLSRSIRLLAVVASMLIAFQAPAIAVNTAPIPPSAPPVVSRGGTGQSGGDATVFAHVSSPGTSSAGHEEAPQTSTDESTGSQASSDPCFYLPIPATKGDPRLSGADPSTGVLYLVSCPDALNATTGNVVFQQQGTVWTPNGVPPAPPPPDPAQIAQEAAGKMTAPDPVIHLGPNAQQVAVKVPVWLWIDPPQPIALTVAVRGLSVTVTAALVSTTWAMGEGDRSGPSSSGGSAVTCTGSGTPPPAHPLRTVVPPCGYTYTWKSLPERTGGTGAYQITATTNWQVSWTASDGTNGTLPAPLTPATTQQVAVGEWRAELVAGR